MKVFLLMTALLAAGRAFPTEIPTYYTDEEEELIALEMEQPLSADSIREAVIFDLYTRANPEIPELIDMHDNPPTNFNPKNPTKVCIHGWQSDGHRMAILRQEYLKLGDFNVVVVNWTRADTIVYPVARLRVGSIGVVVSEFIDDMVAAFNISPESFHLVGHSLGAHISGIAGRATRSGFVGRITGLDPAGVLFKNAADKLSPVSAKFVDVIHTCGNVLGLWEPVGHVDFYPNGGISKQKGCLLDLGTACSHNRATEYFFESVNGDVEFKAVPFEDGPVGDFDTNSNATVMGEHVPNSIRGVYYVETGSQPPFAEID